MKPTAKLILILFGLAYLISPVDIIPDLLLPWVGWIDDSLVLWCVYYLIRYGELPWFFFKRPGKPQPVKKRPVRKKTAGPKTAGSQKTSKKTEQPNAQPRKDSRQSKKQAPEGFGTDTEPSSPYRTLGVLPSASWEEIQAAYKEKIKQYHPDKLSHLGEEFSSLANEKFLEIQAAYNRIKSIRNKS